MKQREKRRGGAGGRLALLLAMLALLTGVLYVRTARTGEAQAVEAAAPPPAESAVETPGDPAAGEERQEPLSAHSPAPTPRPEPTPVPPRPAAYRELRYTNETFSLISDMVYTYRYQQSAGMEAVRERLGRLKAADAEVGAVWESIMEYWDYANTGLEIHYDVLPDGLPEDDSLCLVVLGFQLLPDGGMDPELVGRCEVALKSAEKYPNAFVLVTGGGTAYRNGLVTEAGVMADWLREHGVAAERLIVEDRSLTTAENAVYCDAILFETYPQIRSLAIITSDYHIGMGSVLFHTKAQCRAYETGEAPYAVVSNAAFAVPSMAGTEDAVKQATFLWSVADPRYA